MSQFCLDVAIRFGPRWTSRPDLPPISSSSPLHPYSSLATTRFPDNNYSQVGWWYRRVYIYYVQARIACYLAYKKWHQRKQFLSHILITGTLFLKNLPLLWLATLNYLRTFNVNISTWGPLYLEWSIKDRSLIAHLSDFLPILMEVCLILKTKVARTNLTSDARWAMFRDMTWRHVFLWYHHLARSKTTLNWGSFAIFSNRLPCYNWQTLTLIHSPSRVVSAFSSIHSDHVDPKCVL